MRVWVVGGGILGLALARLVVREDPDGSVVLLEKEARVATPQTGHNSGVVHAGLYYEPGSLKARLCRRGVALLEDFCHTHHVVHDRCGKVLIATSEVELPRLAAIEERARANGVTVARLTASELREVE